MVEKDFLKYFELIEQNKKLKQRFFEKQSRKNQFFGVFLKFVQKIEFENGYE